MTFEQTSLLDRLDAVQIDDASMISEQDKATCEELQEPFKTFVDFSQKYVAFLNDHGVSAVGLGVSPDFKSPQRMKEAIEREVSDATKLFIHRITEHFSGKYHVTIDNESICAKYDSLVTYEDIVREIGQQLGGLNFKERAVKEIKDRLRNMVKSPHIKLPVTITNAKVTIGGHFMYWEESWTKGLFRPNSYDCPKQKALFGALSHFESGQTSILETFLWMCEWKDRADWFETFEYDDLTKVKAVKLFKNGKASVTFSSHELALQFAREYLGQE